MPNDIGISNEMLMDTNMEWKHWMTDRKSRLREEDTDWKRWLLGKPYRPFDPHVYLEFRLYKDFSSGIFDQWLSHGCDLVHLWTDETYPETVVASGGVFVWGDGRENRTHALRRSPTRKAFSIPTKPPLATAIAVSPEFKDAMARSRIMEAKGHRSSSCPRKEEGRNLIRVNLVPPIARFLWLPRPGNKLG